MPEIHVTVRPIDASNNGVSVHNPDNSNGSNQGLSSSDTPAPSQSGKQTTVKVIGTPGVVTRFSNPAIVIF